MSESQEIKTLVAAHRKLEREFGSIAANPTWRLASMLTPDQINGLENTVRGRLGCDHDAHAALTDLVGVLLTALGMPPTPIVIDKTRLAEIEAECRQHRYHAVVVMPGLPFAVWLGREADAWRSENPYDQTISRHTTLRAALEVPVARGADVPARPMFKVVEE